MNKTNFRESLLLLVNCLRVWNQVQGRYDVLELAILENGKIAVATADPGKDFNPGDFMTRGGWMEIDRVVDYFEGWLKAQELASEAGGEKR